MENWLIEVVKILGGAIAGLLLTEAFPSIKAFFKKGSLSLRNREKESIRNEYKRIKIYRENHATLAASSIGQLANIFNGMLLLALFFLVDSVLSKDISKSLFYKYPFVLSFILGYISALINRVVNNIEHALDFENYREKTIKKLRELGGNPEDLDKQETA